MASVYDNDAYAQRVNYAAQCFMRGIRSSRHFDTCFEMNDGAAVVTALVRRAENNPRLYSAISAQWSDGFPQSWMDTAVRFASVPTARLQELAAVLRSNDGRRVGEHVDAFLANFTGLSLAPNVTGTSAQQQMSLF